MTSAASENDDDFMNEVKSNYIQSNLFIDPLRYPLLKTIRIGATAFLFLETLMKRVEIKTKNKQTRLKFNRIALKLFHTSAPGIPLFLNITNIASTTTEPNILTSHWNWRSQADSEKEAEFEVQCAKAVSRVTSNPNAMQSSAFKRLDEAIEKRYTLVTTRSQSLSSSNPVITPKLDEELSVLKLRKAAWDILSFQRNSQLPAPLVLGSSKFLLLCPHFAVSR